MKMLLNGMEMNKDKNVSLNKHQNCVYNLLVLQEEIFH